MFRMIKWAIRTLLLVSGILPFLRCGQGYREKDDKITYNGEAISEKHFVVLNDAFARDSGNAYYREKSIDGADVSSFVAINDAYAKDKNRVYYCDESRDGRNYYLTKYQVIKTVQNVDPGSFVAAEAGYCKDKRQAFYGGRGFAVKDIASFSGIDAHFAKDSVQAYFNCRAVPGTDGKSFTVIDGSYAKDLNHIYFYTDLGDVRKSVFVLPCNSATFKVLDYPFSKDDSKVFYAQFLLRDADAISFAVLTNGFSKDKNAVYIQTKKLVGADPISFVVFKGEDLTSEDYYAKDNAAVYWFDKKLTDVPVGSFTPLGHGYATDGKHVFYKTGIVAKANVESFRVYPHDVGNADATDAHNRFHGGKLAGEDDSNASY